MFLSLRHYDEDVQYDGMSWFTDDKPELIKLNPLMNLPYLVRRCKLDGLKPPGFNI